MTISLYNSYLERMPLVKNERMMDQAQSSIYAQLTTEGRRKMWNGWNNVISIINTNMIHADGGAPLTWNGQKLNIRRLIQKFAETFGKESVVR